MVAMATVVVEEQLPLFVIGTELITTVPQEYEWRKLIATLRKITAASKVPVTYVYGANWSPGPQHVPWWDAVDFIGVDAYYPVATHPNPTPGELAAGWAPIVDQLAALSKANGGKKVLICEVGYTTTDACAMGNHAGGVRKDACVGVIWAASGWSARTHTMNKQLAALDALSP
jgi:hypothetical protein